MGDDDRKLTYSERDRMQREGGANRPPRGKWAEAEDAKRTHDALQVADSLFTDEKGGQEGKALANAVRAAHGSSDLPAACRAYLETVGPPKGSEFASIFLDADDKEISIIVLDALLSQKEAGDFELAGGIKSQIRILSEDFDDDLASRAEDLLE